MRVLVTGGRHLDDEQLVFAALDAAHTARPFSHLIVGDATGADTLARRWATSRGIPYSMFRADWKKHGKKAGPIRNGEMLGAEPDVCVAFPATPCGPGTADMMRQCDDNNVMVLEVRRP